MMHAKRVVLIVVDSVGCGEAPDAASYGDEGSNTLKNTAAAVGGLNLPNLGKMGLGNLTEILGVPPTMNAEAAYGQLIPASQGKDTTTGHWELSGLILDQPFPVYPEGFPPTWIRDFEIRIGRETIGNYPASGTEIIKELGDIHVTTGKPIVYTSADSVFQIAAHEEVIPVDELYRICQVARDLLMGEHAVGRVIARPFIGTSGHYLRTERRKDFSLEPPEATILDVLKTHGFDVIGVGKIEDIFAHRGLTASDHTGNNMAGVDSILGFLQADTSGLIFANLVDFDALYGHRNNPAGYAEALQAFDQRLPEILSSMKESDVLIITADHGNDPTTPSTDHSREIVPLLVYGESVAPNTNLGKFDTFADVAATIADVLGVPWSGKGRSFRRAICH
jgi:phosphopentomutase